MEDGKDWHSESSRSSDEYLRPPRRNRKMKALPRLRDLNPMRLLHSNISYQSLPGSESRSVSPMSLRTMAQRWSEKGGLLTPTTPHSNPFENRRRCGFPRMSFTKGISLIVMSMVILALLVGGGVHHARKNRLPEDRPGLPFHWQTFERLNGYYNGVRTLVSAKEHIPDNQYAQGQPLKMLAETGDYSEKTMPPMDPKVFNPYPDYTSPEYLSRHAPVHTCYIDEAETIPAPDVYAYPGVPQHMTSPFIGSRDVLGMKSDVCFDRFGRFGAYGYGYDASEGGLSLGQESERIGSEKVFQKIGHINYEKVDWGSAQKRCFEKNKARFAEAQTGGKERVKRHAYILRTWAGYKYEPHQILSLRAMINELSLKSGGEYDVHFLVHIKDNSIPIWADKGVYRQTLEENVPEEFWNISTLWSEQLMMSYYPDPFEGNFENDSGGSIHGVYRSAHFPLQWFSQQFPDYDFYWNWEMDLRLSGHYYEFNNAIGQWGRDQPRKGLWERSSRFYIPEVHGSWQNFTKFVEADMVERDAPKNIFEAVLSGPTPVWGPVLDWQRDEGDILATPKQNIPPHSYDSDNYEWGVGQDADFLVFDPLFDPSKTNWVFREDVTGYNTSLPVPPRRVAIITVARLSKSLLNTMHEETFRLKHSMFPEMWPPTIALHYGYKAAYVPHPVYFDRDWDLDHMNQVFNYPKEIHESPFGWGEHNLLGSSFYYNSEFSSALWRRWLGQRENNEGGHVDEENGTGRMCLQTTLFHPIKHERSPFE